MPHTTVARRAEVTEIRTGSRFLTVVAEASTVEDAEALLASLRREHPDATHHCSAWRIGELLASSDDGEPGGTAGRPMLNVILKRDLDRVAAVCVRWYGGTNLGAGGLVRAYSGGVAKALDAAGTRTVHETVTVRVHAPFARADALHRLVDEWPHAERGEVGHDATGTTLAVQVRRAELGEFSRRARDATAGEARVEVETPDGTDDADQGV